MLLAGLFLSFSALQAAQYQSHNDIYQQVKSFLLKNAAGTAEKVEVTVKPIDPRLQLQQCDVPLDIFMPQGSRDTGRTIVGVRCQSPKPWTIYIQAEVIKSLHVYVTTGPISRGATVNESDVELKLLKSNQLGFGYITDKAAVIGMVAKRDIAANTVLTPRMLERAKLVKRGEKVQIIAEVEGVTIHVDGEALEDGAKGDMIRVRNTSSKKIIQAEVIAPGKVRVRL